MEAYEKARRLGLKTMKEAQERHENPWLPVLDELAQATGQELLGEMQIPLDRIAGTKTAGRTNAFAKDFMPVLEANSEFAAKWSRVYEFQLAQGLQDAILVYEYLGMYYVQEGNKRVSVLKFLDAPTILAKVIRIHTKPEDTDAYHLYEEYMDFTAKTGMYDFWFTQKGSYEKLLHLIHQDVWDNKVRADVRSAFDRFSAVFEKLYCLRSGMTMSDAFLVYAETYGLEEGDDFNVHLSGQIERLHEAYDVWPDKPKVRLVTETNPGLKPFFNLRSDPIKMGFIHMKTAETSAWTAEHEGGRQWMEKQLPELTSKAYFGCDDEDLALGAMEAAVLEGCNVLFVTSPLLVRACLKFEAAHPEVKVLCCGLNVASGNIRTYYPREYEAQFLAGMVAGILSHTDQIGYVGDYPANGAIASINAFALGARMVNPEVQVYLDWSTTKESTISMPENIDLMYVAQQSFDRAVQTNKAFGLYDLTHKQFLHILQVQELWGEFYTKMAKRLEEGSWREDAKAEGGSICYWWGTSNHMTAISISEKMPVHARRLVLTMLETVREGFQPFDTELVDQAGNVRKADTMEDLVKMDWLLDNVTGTIPSLDAFRPDAAEIISTLSLQEGA
jgi:basic membrane lipoprotein Med (substrate-binding protein (PBP1-ABC) superfamily)